MRIAVLVLLLAMTVSGASAAGWQTATVSKPISRELRALIQAEHKAVCGKTLVHDPQLRWLARWKAMDMGLHDTLAHKDADGHAIWDFYDHAGVQRTVAGEILGVNTYGLTDTAEQVFAGWMASAGHRAIIRGCGFSRVGVGAFRTQDRRWYAAEFTGR